MMKDRIAECASRDVSRETMAKLERFVALLLEENKRQNLISFATVEHVWNRHVVDGAQLLRFAAPASNWCDIGSGPGLPGLVVAILGDPITLIEPRALRVDFLNRVVDELGLIGATVQHGRAERVAGKFDIITARAVASLPNLFHMASHLAHSGTKWVLPKGQKAKSELDDARRTWQGEFELVPSMTSPEASIVVAKGIQSRGKR